MTCEQAMELLSPWLDGELDPELQTALEAHLETCPNCKALADTLRGLDEAVAGLREPAPQSLKQGVLYKIDQATGKAKKSKLRWFGPGTALGAVAAMLVLLVGLGVIPLDGRSLLAKQATPAAEGYYNSPETQAPMWDGPATEAIEASNGQGNWYSGNKKGQNDHWNQSGGAESPVDTQSPMSEDFEADTIQQTTRRLDSYTDSPEEAEAVSGAPVDACAALSAEEDAMVLLYTEFDSESLFDVLKAEEPALFALVENLDPVERDGMIVFETDCGTALAIHEWLLERLPKPPIMSMDTVEAESNLRARMEELDPGSGSLYRVITWAPADHAVAWPEEWPEGWSDRVRTGENWGLFFPSEDYTPNAGKLAYLAFVP